MHMNIAAVTCELEIWCIRSSAYWANNLSI